MAPGEGAVRLQLDHISEAVADLKQGLLDVNETLKTLIRVEERQISQGADIDEIKALMLDHEKRIKVLEHDIPTLKETRGWVIAAVMVLAIAGFGAFTSGWVSVRGPVEVVRSK